MTTSPYLRTGSTHQCLLEVTQSLLEDFGLEDTLRVKLVAAQATDPDV